MTRLNKQILEDPFFEVYATFVNEHDITGDREHFTGQQMAQKLIDQYEHVKLSDDYLQTDSFRLLYETCRYWLSDAKIEWMNGDRLLAALYATLLFIDIFQSPDEPRQALVIEARLLCKLYWVAISVTRLLDRRRLFGNVQVDSYMADLLHDEMRRFNFSEERLGAMRNLSVYDKLISSMDSILTDATGPMYIG